jgi:hypothetical protein
LFENNGTPIRVVGGTPPGVPLFPKAVGDGHPSDRAVGYNYEAVKIFMPAGREHPVYAPYVEHVPPDVTAQIYWLKNRDPQHWRDSQQLEHVLGRYLISDKPMSEEDWARERATMIDDEQTNNVDQTTPRFGDGREERHLEAAKRLSDSTTLAPSKQAK